MVGPPPKSRCLSFRIGVLRTNFRMLKMNTPPEAKRRAGSARKTSKTAPIEVVRVVAKVTWTPNAYSERLLRDESGKLIQEVVDCQS